MKQRFDELKRSVAIRSTALLLLTFLLFGCTLTGLKKDSHFINLFEQNKTLFKAYVKNVSDYENGDKLDDIADKLSDVGVTNTFGPEVVSPDITFYFRDKAPLSFLFPNNVLAYKSIIYIKSPNWLTSTQVSLDLDSIDPGNGGTYYRRIEDHWFLKLELSAD